MVGSSERSCRRTCGLSVCGLKSEFNHLLLSAGLQCRSMLMINYPEPEFRMKKENDKELVFDSLRRKWLLITPEEWVRQNFVQYLVRVMNYPASLIALEKEIWLGELKKRFDILVYSKDHQPWMIVECKGTDIKLTDETLQQALRYNISVPADYLVITNGQYSYGWAKRDGQLHELDILPAWEGRKN